MTPFHHLSLPLLSVSCQLEEAQITLQAQKEKEEELQQAMLAAQQEVTHVREAQIQDQAQGEVAHEVELAAEDVEGDRDEEQRITEIERNKAMAAKLQVRFLDSVLGLKGRTVQT